MDLKLSFVHLGINLRNSYLFYSISFGVRRKQNYPQSREALRKTVEGEAFLYYEQSIPTE